MDPGADWEMLGPESRQPTDGDGGEGKGNERRIKANCGDIGAERRRRLKKPRRKIMKAKGFLLPSS